MRRSAAAAVLIWNFEDDVRKLLSVQERGVIPKERKYPKEHGRNEVQPYHSRHRENLENDEFKFGKRGYRVL